MLKGQAHPVQGDLLAALAVSVAVVADQGMAGVGHLRADLVGTAGLQADGAEAAPVFHRHGHPVQDGQLAFPEQMIGHDGHDVFAFVLFQIVDQAEAGLRLALADADVLPAQLMLPDLFGKPLGRLAGPGEDQQAAHRPVHPVDQADIRFAGLLIFFFHVTPHLGKQVRVAGGVPLGQEVFRLHHHQQVVVFIQDV